MASSSQLNFIFVKMFDNQDQTDCVFQLKKSSSTSKSDESNEEPVLIRAHKLILSAASPVFKKMISERWSSDEKKPIEIKDVKDTELFKEFIRYGV